MLRGAAVLFTCAGMIAGPLVVAEAPARLPMSPLQAVGILQEHSFFTLHHADRDEEFEEASRRFLAQLELWKKDPLSVAHYPWLAELFFLAERGETPFLLQPRLLQAFLSMGGNINARDERGLTAMDYALRLSTKRFFRLLRDAGAAIDVTAHDSEGMTMLMYAAQDADADTVSWLLEQGSYVNDFSEQGETVLSFALRSGDETCVRLLLEAGARLSPEFEDDDGCTQLHAAAEGGMLHAVSQLLQAGAAVDITTQDGETPLMLAAAEGHTEVVRRLLAAGASPLRKDANDENALQMAVAAGDAAAVEQILNHAARSQTPVSSQELAELLGEVMSLGEPEHGAVARLLMKRGADIDIDKDGWNYLGRAIRMRDEELLRMLEAAGAEYDATTPDDDGMTHLMLAATYSFPQLVDRLLDDGADPQMRDDFGAGLLHDALYGRNPSIVRRLLQAGLQLDARERDMLGRTQLMLASGMGDEQLVRKLLDEGADVNALSSMGESALTFATAYGRRRIISMLRAAGARCEPLRPGEDGMTMLMYAARGGVMEILEESLAAGVYVDAMVHYPAYTLQPLVGCTALMLAAEGGHEAIARRLLAAGADPSLADAHGRTAADYAAEAGHQSLAELLRNAEKYAAVAN